MATPAPKVFISYTRADSEVAQRIAHDLEAMGVKVASEGSTPLRSEPLAERLRDAVRTGDILLILISSAPIGSSASGEGLDTALLAELSERAITVVPALIADGELPPALANRQHLDLRADFEGAVRRLAEQLSVAPEIDFASLEATDFERLVHALVEDLGFTVDRARRGPDRGYDLVARAPEGKIWMIEAKQYGRARVDLASVNRLIGAAAANGIDRALLVTSGQLTSAARQHIEDVTERGLVKVDVVDRTTLTALLLQRPELARRFFDRP